MSVHSIYISDMRISRVLCVCVCRYMYMSTGMTNVYVYTLQFHNESEHYITCTYIQCFK